jgi:hypothetical protein
MYLTTLNTEAAATARHAYAIEVGAGEVKVYASNRAQAARIAEKAGHVVRSVNMIG